jgi:hypothetical protein
MDKNGVLKSDINYRVPFRIWGGGRSGSGKKARIRPDPDPQHWEQNTDLESMGQNPGFLGWSNFLGEKEE